MKHLQIMHSITQRDELLTAYFNEARQFDLLNPEDECTLAKHISSADKDDYATRNKLVEHNLRFAVSVAKQYQGQGVPLMDLIQMANIGLIRAAEKFDFSRGIKFTSFAAVYIRAEILDEIEKHGRMIAVSHEITNLQNKYRALCEAMLKEEGHKPTAEDFADFAEIDLIKAKRVINSESKIESLDLQLDSDDDGYTLFDTIVGGSIDESSFDDDGKHDALIRALEEVLGERDAKAMMANFGLINMTMNEVAMLYDTNYDALRRTIERSIDKIRRNKNVMRNLMEYRSAA